MGNNTTKLYFDCEFTSLNQNAQLISMGIVAEDGRYFYCELNDYDKEQLNDWLKENVISQLVLSGGRYNYASKHLEAMNVYGTRDEVRQGLEQWLSQFNNVIFYGDVPHYDWLLFCELFGGAFGIPENVYYICFDLATAFLLKGINPDIEREKYLRRHVPGSKHNALYDAQIVKGCFEKLERRVPTVAIIGVGLDQHGKYLYTSVSGDTFMDRIATGDPVADFKAGMELGKDKSDYILLSSGWDEFVSLNEEYGWKGTENGDEIYKLAPHER